MKIKKQKNTVLRLWIEPTESVSYTYGKAKLTWFEEIFEEYDKEKTNKTRFLSRKLYLIRQNDITKSGLSIHCLIYPFIET